MIVVGVDPGANHTGICVVSNGEAVWSDTIHREIGEHATDFAARCAAVVGDRPGELVGIEDINSPNPHMGMTNPKPHIETGIVLGAIWQALAEWTYDAVIVPPGGHGSHPIGFYPEALRGVKGQRGNGEGRYRHERSAWDIAQAAPTYWALQQAHKKAET